MSTLKEYLSTLPRGGRKKFAEAIGANPDLVYQWAHGIRKPDPQRCSLIERETGGQVTRPELRPDIQWLVTVNEGHQTP